MFVLLLIVAVASLVAVRWGMAAAVNRPLSDRQEAVYKVWFRLKAWFGWVEPAGTVSALWVHPIKLFRGFSTRRWTINAHGLKFDRMYSLGRWDQATQAYKVITQREFSRISLCSVEVDGDHLVVSWPKPGATSVDEVAGTFKLPTDPVRSAKDDAEPIVMWGVGFGVLVVDKALPEQFIADMQLPADTVMLHTAGGKEVKTGAPAKELLGDTTLSYRLTLFQDYFPSLVVTDEDIADVGQRVQAAIVASGRKDLPTTFPVTNRNFRGNIVIKSGRQPYDSDTWLVLRLTDTHGHQHAWRVASKCPRCAIPNIDHNTGKLRGDVVMSRTLGQFRRVDAGDPKGAFFGVNCVHLGDVEYEISVGDRVEVLERRITHYQELL